MIASWKIRRKLLRDSEQYYKNVAAFFEQSEQTP